MLDKRTLNTVVDTTKVVWMCLSCKKHVIGDKTIKPVSCPCSIPNYVIAGNLVVTK